MSSEEKSSNSIKNWANDDRPREKLMAKGKEALSDSELLAILLRSGLGDGTKSALDLAKEIMNDCDNNLTLLSRLSIGELTKFSGMGPVKAITIIAAMELGRRRSAGQFTQRTRINTSKDAAQYCRHILKDHQQEVFMVLFLKTNNQIIDHKIPFKGGMSATIVDSKIIYQMALERKATQLIFCHNHPSGNLNPSKQDIALTNRLVEAGKLLDIKAIDHIIVSEEGYYSFADDGRI